MADIEKRIWDMPWEAPYECSCGCGIDIEMKKGVVYWFDNDRDAQNYYRSARCAAIATAPKWMLDMVEKYGHGSI